MYTPFPYLPAPHVPMTQVEAPPADAPSEKEHEEAEEGTNVYYTGMDPNATKEHVVNVFNKFGDVSDCKILIGALHSSIFSLSGTYSSLQIAL